MHSNRFILALVVAAAIALSVILNGRFLARPSLSFRPTPLTEQYNVILVVVDTLNAKDLGLGTTTAHRRFLSAFSRESLVFERAFSPSSWTRPSTASILTGYHPTVHGATTFERGIREDIPTLAERFKIGGYVTAGFVSNLHVAPRTTFRRGYDTYELVGLEGDFFTVTSSPQLTDKATKFLSEQAKNPESQFFLYLHYFDPHYHYIHHPEFDRSSWYSGQMRSNMDWKSIQAEAPSFSDDDLRYVKDLYDEEVDFTDLFIQKLVETLKSSPFAENTLLVITADHGEEFKNHGHMGHGNSLYEELVHVPLLLWAPKRVAPGRISTWVSTYDITPTLSGMEPLAAAPEYTGRALPLTENEGAERDLFLSVHYKPKVAPQRIEAIVRRPYKFIRDFKANRAQLFNIENDPLERDNLISTQPDVATSLSERLERSFTDLAPFNTEPQQVDPPWGDVELNRLRSIGYFAGK